MEEKTETVVARQPPGRKRRTRGHVIADLGVNAVERVVLECGFVAERRQKDYGVDLLIDTFDENGEVEAGCINAQIKASDDPVYSVDGQSVMQRVATADLKTWLFDVVPVIVILYDAARGIAYWVDVQEYVRNHEVNLLGTKSATVRMPISQAWNHRAVRSLRAMKNDLNQRIAGGRRYEI